MTPEQQPETVTSTDGTAIAWWRTGEGRPLVLVHGTTADHTRWVPVLDLLARDASVCALDRRGRGSSGDTEPYALEREYEDVAAVVDALADRWGGPVDVFGHSHGALCALEAAPLTGNIRALVLYEPPLLLDDGYPTDLLGRLDALIAEGRREEALQAFFREVVHVPDEQLAMMRTLPVWPARVAAVHTVPREERAALAYRFDPTRAAGITVPTLLLRGTESPPFLQRSTDALADALPDVRVADLEGHQHVAIDTAPQLVADTVLAFLAAVSPGVTRSPTS